MKFGQGNARLSHHKNSSWEDFIKASALGLPLLLVLLASVFAAIPAQYRPAAQTDFLSRYPIRIDLVEVKEITGRRDFSKKQALFNRQAQIDDDSLETRLLNPLIVQEPVIQQERLPVLVRNEPAAQSAAAGSLVAANVGASRIRSIDFDLAGGPNSASTLEVSKELQRRGQIIGRIDIRVDNNSAIYVAREELLRLLPSAPADVEQLEGEFITLSALRGAGVNVRYDPVGDRLMLVD